MLARSDITLRAYIFDEDSTELGTITRDCLGIRYTSVDGAYIFYNKVNLATSTSELMVIFFEPITEGVGIPSSSLPTYKLNLDGISSA